MTITTRSLLTHVQLSELLKKCSSVAVKFVNFAFVPEPFPLLFVAFFSLLSKYLHHVAGTT